MAAPIRPKVPSEKDGKKSKKKEARKSKELRKA
jgi:hypothetical protein